MSICLGLVLVCIFAEASAGASASSFLTQVFGGSSQSSAPAILGAENDSTRALLATIFGSVNGIFNVTDGQAALLFKIFNVSAMMFGSLFAGITITQTVISTASQGIFMGKKGSQSGYFTIFRTFGGMALVFPQYNGYCIAQFMVMHIVIKSIALASLLSFTILSESITFSPELLFNTSTTQSTPATNIGQSQLRNTHVQGFYKAVIKGSICAVTRNRERSVPSANPNSLFSISGGEITFMNGECDSINLNFNNIANYQPRLEVALGLLVRPVVTYIFNNLPAITTPGAERNCFGPSPTCSSGPPAFLVDTQRRIEASHDALASLFMIQLPSLSNLATGCNPGNNQNYLYNWLNFPVMYQSVMDVKGSGRVITSLECLVKTALEVTSSSHNTAEFTSLASIVGSPGTPNTTDYDSEIDSMSFVSQLTAPSAVTISGASGLKTKMYQYLDTLMIDTNYPRPNAQGQTPNRPMTLIDVWNTENWSTFDEGAATFSNSMARLRRNEWGERALKSPVNAFVFYTADKWIDTYIDNTNEIVLSPARKLGEVASFFAGQSTLFTFTVTRNVMAEQFIRSYNIFWTFFGSKLALNVGTAVTALAQEFAWDWMHCMFYPAQPLGPGASLRRPFCNPILFGIFPNPGYPAEFSVAATLTGVITAINVTMHVTDSIVSNMFTYLHLIATQFEYAYYGYVAMAAMPVMVITNLLSIWIPMMPSLVFYVSLVGWLFAVIEAMLAAPLVVMGITFPQGHDLLGSAQQAMALFLGLFLRAPLIIVGFFVGMLMLSISIKALSYGVIGLGIQMFTENQPQIGDGFLLYGFMVLTLYITSILLMQAMGIMYKLPTKVLLWVGGQATDNIEEETVKAIEDLVKQQQGSVLGALNQSAVSAKSASEGTAQSATGGFQASGSLK